MKTALPTSSCRNGSTKRSITGASGSASTCKGGGVVARRRCWNYVESSRDVKAEVVDVAFKVAAFCRCFDVKLRENQQHSKRTNRIEVNLLVLLLSSPANMP
ncbi:uncharacterized protein PITG_08498 [Phytophthora infestans T30-4]|uniref:Uncharacterized protein n=1 Tax=Phytophthora infestans (strain T30-4) TaxID=403677 RepID=D0NAS0_PHYIT|nr:uncharacterized protein PITG_08498 [Phytophthora infestans T30-4]EEY54928.1 hypothetical protein PITG_08498 [Phytophthora infestans T30-4]|eukprot:XP_002903873.1 hypothetical protein PITG_08498 [Phytophthora infestans T30-4]